MKRLLALSVAAVASVSCTPSTYVDPSLICGGGLDKEWTVSRSPPPNSESLRELAEKSPNDFSGEMVLANEVWFSTANGDQLLCKAEEGFCFGEWWQFKNADHGHAISKQSWFGCFN
jgi:hypothetical protein